MSIVLEKTKCRHDVQMSNQTMQNDFLGAVYAFEINC